MSNVHQQLQSLPVKHSGIAVEVEQLPVVLSPSKATVPQPVIFIFIICLLFRLRWTRKLQHWCLTMAVHRNIEVSVATCRQNCAKTRCSHCCCQTSEVDMLCSFIVVARPYPSLSVCDCYVNRMVWMNFVVSFRAMAKAKRQRWAAGLRTQKLTCSVDVSTAPLEGRVVIYCYLQHLERYDFSFQYCHSGFRTCMICGSVF